MTMLLYLFPANKPSHLSMLTRARIDFRYPSANVIPQLIWEFHATQPKFKFIPPSTRRADKVEAEAATSPRRELQNCLIRTRNCIWPVYNKVAYLAKRFGHRLARREITGGACSVNAQVVPAFTDNQFWVVNNRSADIFSIIIVEVLFSSDIVTWWTTDFEIEKPLLLALNICRKWNFHLEEKGMSRFSVEIKIQEKSWNCEEYNTTTIFLQLNIAIWISNWVMLITSRK